MYNDERILLKESMIMLSVVIPTFNESKNIRNLVAQIDVALKGVDYEIVFVDDRDRKSVV